MSQKSNFKNKSVLRSVEHAEAQAIIGVAVYAVSLVDPANRALLATAWSWRS